MIQQILGHKSLSSTEIYLHVTQPAMVQVHDVVDRLMADI
jgi:site-specific recombinase XerD